MTRIGPLSGLPTACALTPDTGRSQVEKWCAFDDDYLLSVEGAKTRLVVHYSKVHDSIRRLRALVEVEVEVEVEGRERVLLAALNVGSPRWPVDSEVGICGDAMEFRFNL